MRLFSHSCTVSFVLVFLAPASAQTVLTEAEALARVSLESPRIRAIRAQLDLARADSLAASRWPNPAVTFNRESVSGVTESFMLVSQPLPVTGRRRLAGQSASAEASATGLRVDDLIRRIHADARRAFVDLSAEQMRARELTSALADIRALAAVLAAREAAGDAAGFDRLRAEREALDIDASLAETRARVARAQGALARFFFPVPDPRDLHAAPLTGERAPIPGPDDLAERAEAARPDLLALERDIEAARLAGDAALRSRIPEPEVVAGLKTSSARDSRNGSVVSLVVSIPLFDRARPERARADARERLAAAERDALRAEIGAAVRALRHETEERRAAADTFRQAGLTASDALRRIAQLSYDAGERSILELLDAYRAASDARVRLIELEIAAAHAEIDLELATAVEIRR
ncbi:MAG: TolC family protein [Acidobacteriota bacterium]